MPLLTEVHFQNYRSFLDAKCRLSPVTVVIGANNAGKSSFLRGLLAATMNEAPARGQPNVEVYQAFNNQYHRRSDMMMESSHIRLRRGDDTRLITFEPIFPAFTAEGFTLNETRLYRLNEGVIGTAETDTEQPIVHSDGEGVTRVLQMLSLTKRKTFQQIEEEFRKFVPEVEELTFERADQGKWFLQVREKGLEEAPVALSEMSEGTRTILALLTIIHQPNRPELILLEDIENAIHPRGLKPLVETMRAISKEHGVQFIFTTHRPFVLDAFQPPEFWDDVVIVEKTDGVSRLTNAKDRLVAMRYDREMDKVPLGDLWYSGLLGGVAGPSDLWDEEKPKPVTP